MKKIEKKITGYEVVKPETKADTAKVEKKLLERDEVLVGQTYKIKTPHSEHAMYVTINDVVDEQGKRRPFELFINTKNMEHFMWIVALTRIVSAIFRHGDDASFIASELKAVFDPRGGYYKKGGKYMPSIVAEIGEVLEKHMIAIGYLDAPEISDELKAKRQEAEDKLGAKAGGGNGRQCDKCGAMDVVRLDNCDCCLSCGNSKCG